MTRAEKALCRLTIATGIPITLLFGHFVYFSGQLFPALWEWFKFWLGSL